VPDPAAGLIDHTTPVSVLVPLTVALNCCVVLRFTAGAVGLTAETNSFDAIVAIVLLDLLALAWLVAVTVTLALAGRSLGAV